MSTAELQDPTSHLYIASELRELLACPDCRHKLNESAVGLSCPGCQRDFPVAAGGTLPILLSRSSPLFSESYSTWRRVEKKGTRKKSYRESRFLPKTSVCRLSVEPWNRFMKLVGTGRLLNIGSGEKRVTTNLDRWVNLDICPHNNVDVVGDAHQLPFVDESFDAVASNNVFAALQKPFHVAAEITRVLKPNGLMWCNEAFALPIARSPGDYFRYAPDGLKSVFDGLTPVEIAGCAGPFTIMARFAETAADAMFPGKLGFAARWCTAWTLQPFKYLDDWLVKRNPDCASAFFLVAQKPGE